MTERMKILIGYDGSESAVSMLEDLKSAGLPNQAEVKVVSVGEVWLASPTEDDASPLFDRETPKKLANEACTRLKVIFPDWELTPEGEVGSAAMQIIAVADEWKPNLIILGSQGLSALGRFFFGSVSQKVVTEAHCSVHIGRGKAGRAAGAGVRLVVAFDGSEQSEAAVKTVASRNWPEGSEVILVTSIDLYAIDSTSHMPSSHAIGTNVIIPKASEQRHYAEQIQKKAEEILKGTGLKVVSVIREEDPKKAIIDTAEKAGADCIFVGSRGLGRIRRFLLGSVSSAIVTRAHCSVEIVRC
ncbi:MAG: universal stress protein [Blastocatellia bacterium]|nr:universal stress protein [Blastocatellia bacterium]